MFEQVMTSIEILAKLEAEGKILAGGLPSTQRRHVFIIEAESNDEVTELIQGLPFLDGTSMESCSTGNMGTSFGLPG